MGVDTGAGTCVEILYAKNQLSITIYENNGKINKTKAIEYPHLSPNFVSSVLPPKLCCLDVEVCVCVHVCLCVYLFMCSCVRKYKLGENLLIFILVSQSQRLNFLLFLFSIKGNEHKLFYVGLIFNINFSNIESPYDLDINSNWSLCYQSTYDNVLFRIFL